MDFRLGELFCGPGGLGLGAKMAAVKGAGISHIWATDYDRDSCKTYKANLAPKVAPLADDIRKLKFDKLAKKGAIDALAFGFPCNDFSVVGRKAGVAGTFGGLYAYCVKAVEHYRPLWFVAENVGGLRSADEGNTFSKILREFARRGYRIYPHLYKFDEYGVPQKRQRIIIIGIRADQNVDFRIPAPKRGKIDNTAQTALREIPWNAPNHELTRQSEIVIERLKHIKPGENAFTANLPKNLQLRINGAKISQIYRRLMPDQPAYTITGSGGGGTHVYHWKEPRALTNRERARLQTFPDDFVFHGQKESVRKQVGMAVPPIAARAIFEAVLKSFADISYPHIPPNIEPLRARPHDYQ